MVLQLSRKKTTGGLKWSAAACFLYTYFFNDFVCLKGLVR